MRPPFAYYGGKMSMADTIVSLLPDHDHYVEPFGGSLAVLLAKPPVGMETVNDLDGDLMAFWEQLRDRPDELIRACALTPHGRAEHERAREPAEDELERARRTWVLLSQSRAGALRRTGWRHYVNPAGSSASMPRYLAGYVDRMAAVAHRLQRVSLECRHALEVIESYGRSEDVLLYVDPPYLGSARNSVGYRHEMPDEADHAELAEALSDVASAVVVSGYPSPLYDRLYADWERRDVSVGTGQGGAWESRTEVLWSNRPLTVSVQPSLLAGVADG